MLSPAEKAQATKALAEELTGRDATTKIKMRGLMCPKMRALEHPAAPLLLEYARNGCSVDVERNWTMEEL